MNFDELKTADCLVPDADRRIPCPTNLSEFDLILKPAYAMRDIYGTVQYRAYIVNAQGEEKQVISNVKYRSSTLTVAQIGGDSGLASGLKSGRASISAEWQDHIGSAILDVMDCSSISVGICLVIDNSYSMTQPFNTGALSAGQLAYSTKMDAAKDTARLFVSELITSKDYMGIVSFSEAAVEKSDLSQNPTDLETSIYAINQSVEKTNIWTGLKTAIKMLDDSTLIDKKVIFLISDGYDNSENDPVSLANEFKGNGGVIIVLGIRASGEAYTRLHEIATDGLFFNVYQTNSQNLMGYVSDFKGYICAGNCEPSQVAGQPYGALNYTGFANWDVATGENVDLIGGTYPYQFFDLIPGNGLYVDMIGSTAGEVTGSIGSKNAYAISTGQQYKLTVTIAGNQRHNHAGDIIQLSVQGAAGEWLNSNPLTIPADGDAQEITIDNWLQDFTEYSFTFTATQDDLVIIGISQTQIGAGGLPWAGVLLGYVKFENITVPNILLEDDFDSENLTAFDEPSSEGDGCPTEPVVEQASDPDPLPDLEACEYGGEINQAFAGTGASVEESEVTEEEEEEEEELPPASCSGSYGANLTAQIADVENFFTGIPACGSWPTEPADWDGTFVLDHPCEWVGGGKIYLDGALEWEMTAVIKFFSQIEVTEDCQGNSHDGPAYVLEMNCTWGASTIVGSWYKDTGSDPTGTYVRSSYTVNGGDLRSPTITGPDTIVVV